MLIPSSDGNIVPNAPKTAAPLLSVRDLSTHFFTRDGVVRAVDGFSMDVLAGETVAIVGESGCGKSITSLSILRLVAAPAGRIVSGSISFSGRDLVLASEREMRRIRGKEISMIFQEPMTSLNPVFSAGEQIAETLMLHEGLTRRQAMARAVELLRLVQISEPERRAAEYPHQMSGGMRQRVMIAMALACNPKLLIADEPTTALDVTIQAQILDLMRDLKQQTGAAIIFITHDLGVVAEMAERVVVMYAGRKIEEASVKEIFASPSHPYTVGLLRSVPRLGSSQTDGENPRLQEIRGVVPTIRKKMNSCPFEPRCEFATDICRREMPPLMEVRPGHAVACFYAERVMATEMA